MAWLFDLLFGSKPVQAEEDDLPRRRRPRDDNKEEHGLPERIRKLPKDDPERIRFEKGWKDRKRQEVDTEYTFSFSSSPLFVSLTSFVILGVVAALGYSAYEAHEKYMQEVYALRATIHITLNRKGYESYDPLVYSMVVRAEGSKWIPTLEEILDEVSAIRPKLAVEWSSSNPSSGSYLSHITKSNLPFDEADAMRWTVNEYRSR